MPLPRLSFPSPTKQAMLLLLLGARNVILKHGALGKCEKSEYNFLHVHNCGISKHVHSTQGGGIPRSIIH